MKIHKKLIDFKHLARMPRRFEMTSFAFAAVVILSGKAYAQESVGVNGTDGKASVDAVLPAVSVNATAEADATTEGSGSYAAQNATIAGKTAQSLQETPNSVSVVSSQRMADQNMVTLEDALQYTTGVTAVSWASSAYYSARGYQLGIEYDGVPLFNSIQYLPQLDLAFYDRIEVFRGPAGVIDGVGNPGGTVNMVRKRPLDTFHVSTQTEVSSFGGARQSIDVTGALNKEGTLRGRAVIVGSDEHQSIDRYRKKEFGAYGILEYDIDPRTTLAFSAAHQVNADSDLDYGVGGMSNGARLPTSWTQNFGPSWNYINNIIDEVSLNLTHRFENGWKSDTSLLYRHDRYNATDAYPLGAPGANPYEQSYYGEANRIGYNSFGFDTHVSGPVHLFGRDHTLTFGASYSQDTKVQAYGGETIGTFNVLDAENIPRPDDIVPSYSYYHYQQGGVYGQAHIQITSPLAVTLGARGVWYQETSRTQGSDWGTQARINGRFVPYAGITYDILPQLTAYASYSSVFAPQTGTTSTGAALAPQSGKQYEAGLKASVLHQRLNASVAVFRIDNDHYAISDPANPNFYVDAGKVRSQGWEAEVTGEPLPGWNVYAGYTLLSTDYLSGGSLTGEAYDAEEPHSLFKLWTTYRFRQGLLHGWMIGGGMFAQTATSRATAQYEQGGYAVYNAQVGYTFDKHTSATLTLNNLFDRRYYARTVGTYFSQFGDRRNVMLSVRTDF
jgi:outer membrane receptor for ferric coprogen and ferric-rhodotorulic acid